MKINTQTKIGLGSVMAVIGALVIVLLLILGEPAISDTWLFLLAFVGGIFAGVGATLSIAGLIERRHGS